MDDSLTAVDLWADIIAAHRLPDPPRGGKTVAQFADEINKSEAHARVILKALIAAGEMEARQCRRPSDGAAVMYYWPKEEA